MRVHRLHDIYSGTEHPLMVRLSETCAGIGLQSIVIDCRDTTDPEERARRIGFYLRREKGEFLLAGIGMGAYVSLVAAQSFPPVGLFLVTPALFMPGYPVRTFRTAAEHIEVVHGWGDLTVPYRNSIKFAQDLIRMFHEPTNSKVWW